MTIFLLFLLALGIAATIIGQSLIEQRRRRWIVPLVLSALPVALSPLLVRTGRDTILAAFNNVAVIQWLSLLMISEGLLTVWMGLGRIASHYESGAARKRTLLFFLPSSSCLAAPPALALYVMTITAAWNYRTIAIICGAGFALFLISAQAVVSRMVKEWGQRFELRMFLALVQIIGATFIPLVLNPVSFFGEAPDLSWKTVGVFLVFSALFITIGYFVNTFISLWRRSFNGTR